MVSTAPERRLKFAPDGGFHAELKRRVRTHFDESGRSDHGNTQMYVKTAIILAWLASSYVLLVFVASAWWQALLLGGSLAMAVAGVGFAIQHDGNHGAYSRNAAVNRVMGLTLDLLGGSSYVWSWKHNVFHHSYPNLSGADEDIEVGPFGRMCEAQRRRSLHRFQHLYMWGLYGFLVPVWHFVDDLRRVTSGRIAENRFPRPRGLELLGLVGGKALFVGWALVLPMFWHPWWIVLIGYGAVSFVVGVVLAVVFQLAHCVDAAEFPEPGPDGRLTSSWGVHQVRTTANFACDNRVITWYVGGLNFQIEHHLFPKVCHVHYPQLARIVRAVCTEHGVPYAAHDGLFDAAASHWRWLRKMGEPAGSRGSAGAGGAVRAIV